MGNAFERSIEERLEKLEAKQELIDRESGYSFSILSKICAQFYEVEKGIRNLRELQKILLNQECRGRKE